MDLYKVVRRPIDNAATPPGPDQSTRLGLPKNDVTRRKVQNEQELIRRQPQDLQFLPCSPREQPCKKRRPISGE
jgi:hypothetical protein